VDVATPGTSLPLAMACKPTGTEMKNFPYLDRPFVPLAVALRSMLAETEAKIATTPAEKARLVERAEVLRGRLTLKSTIPVST